MYVNRHIFVAIYIYVCMCIPLRCIYYTCIHILQSMFTRWMGHAVCFFRIVCPRAATSEEQSGDLEKLVRRPRACYSCLDLEA